MRITISVPKPCHEDWAGMTPQDQGRHCAKCAHVVADLTNATDAELVTLFTSDNRPKCARFDPRQLDRLLSPRSEQPTHVLPIAAFSSLLAVAAGQEALAQSSSPPPTVGGASITVTAPPPPVVMGKMMLPIPPAPCPAPVKGEAITQGQAVAVRPLMPLLGDTIMRVEPGTVHEAVEPTRVTGRLVDGRTGAPLPMATVRIAGSRAASASDPEGYFALNVPDSLHGQPFDLEILEMGFEPQVVHVGDEPPALGAAPDRQPYHILRKISGRVIDASDNRSIADATVVLSGTPSAGSTNEHGLFGFDPPEPTGGPGACVLIISAPGYRTQRVPLAGDRWPLAATVKLERGDPADQQGPPATTIALGDVMLASAPVAFMGEAVITLEPSKWRKLTRPVRKIFR